MAKIEGTDFSNVEEIKSELEFYSAVLSSHKELFSSNSGFDLYFFNEINRPRQDRVQTFWRIFQRYWKS